MSKCYRIGIVGTGWIAGHHIKGMTRHPDTVKPVALCDPDTKILKSQSEEFGIKRTHTRLEDMISQGDLDAVVVCTPTHIRKQVLLPLIKAGLPILCEKPFAETYAEAVEVEQAARQAGVTLAINQNFRRHFPFFIARQILAENKIGQPYHLVQVVATLRRDEGWRLERDRYVMAVYSIHWFDGYRYLLQDEPEWVSAQSINSPATEGGDDTAVSVIIQFRQGTVVCLSQSFSSFTKPDVCSLDCAAGGLKMTHEGVTEIRVNGDEVFHKNPFDFEEAIYLVLEDLIKSHSAGRQPETSAWDNLKSLAIMEAAYKSIKEHRPIHLKELSSRFPLP